MDYYWLTARSITHAQRMQKVLGDCRLHAQMRRTPPEMSNKGCGYMIRVEHDLLRLALQCLEKSGVTPVKVFETHGDTYLEVDYDLF